MGVFKEINRADGGGVTTFYRISNVVDTVETDDEEGQAVIIDYNQAQNKPSINGVALVGDKTSSDLGLQPAGDYITNDEADAKFIDEDELLAYDYVNETQLEEALANIEHFHREIVAALPVTGKDNVLYMVRKEGSGEDIYNEYVWVGLSSSPNGYEFIGTTAADLTDYYKKSEVNTLLSNKVDKEYGKGLSEQNYTLAEKTKLAGLENYDDSELQADVTGLNTRVNNISTSSTALNNRVTALEPKVETNSAAVTTIYDLLDKKMTAIRLVEQGDGWVWMNLEGSRLTYAQASAALGHENCMLFIEQLENDGKVIPAEYKSEGDHINVIFKDLDSLVHVMTCGEDDVIVTEDITTTNGRTNFTVEDEAIGYMTEMTAMYGDTKQNQYFGKNLLHVNDSVTKDGVTMTNRHDGSFTITGTASSATDLWVANGLYYNDGAYAVSFAPGDTFTLRRNVQWGIANNQNWQLRIVVYNSDNDTYDWGTFKNDSTFAPDYNGKLMGIEILVPNGCRFESLTLFPQLERGDEATNPEPYVGKEFSPRPDLPQTINTIAGNKIITTYKKNLFLDSDTFARNADRNWVVGGIIDTNVTKDGSYSVRTEVAWNGPGINFKDLYDRGIIKIGDTVTYSVYFKTNFVPNGEVAFGFTCYRDTSPIGTLIRTFTPQQITPDTWYRLVDTFVVNKYTIEQVRTRIECNYYVNDNKYYFGSSGATNYIWYAQPQLEIGSSVSDYEPNDFREYPLSFGSIELCKIDNCQDKIYKENDIWYLHKETGKVVLDGSEDWTSGGLSFYVSINNKKQQSSAISSHFIHSDVWSSSDIQYKGKFTANTPTGEAHRLKFMPTDINITTVEQWKTWLSTHNTTAYYILETPTDTEITDQTLLAQLEVLEQITQYKHTYITITGADLTPEADFTYIDNVVINNTDLILGKDTYWNNEVPTSADLPANAQEGEIRIVQDTEAVYIYDGTDWIPFDKGTEVDLSNYLAKDNTTAWIPTAPFNPATKKYVDDSVSGIHIPTKVSQLQNDSNFVTANVNNLTNYYLKTNTYTKNEVDALIHSGGTGVQVVVVGDTLVITTALPGGE